MIISCEHEVVGKDSILRIWPAQDPREGAELAGTIESLSDIEARLTAAEDAHEEAESNLARVEEKLEEITKAIQGAITKLREASEMLEGVL